MHRSQKAENETTSVLVYRAPDLSVEIFDHFEIFLQNIEHENKDVILTGDLNCNLLSTETNRKIEKFQDLMRNYQLYKNNI